MTAHALLVALRSLRAAPVFTATALVTLALGIGANTSMFSVLIASWLPARQAVRVDPNVALRAG